MGASARPLRTVALSLTGLVVGLAGLGAPAAADRPTTPTYPTQGQVDRARDKAREAEATVAGLQADLVLANQRLEAAAVEAEQAYEAYNGARWLLEEATADLRRARADARRAERQVARQRVRLAALVAASYQDGGDVSAMTAVLGAEGPRA